MFRTFKQGVLSAIAMMYIAGCPKPDDDTVVDDDVTVNDDDTVGDDDSVGDDDTSPTDDDDSSLDQLPVFKQPTSSFTTQEGVNYAQQYVAANATSYSVQTKLDTSKYSFNTETGLLQLLNPNDAEVGAHQFTVTATNQYGSAQHQSTVTVENVNEAPVITTTELPSGVSSVLYSAQITATDEDAGDTLSFAIISGSVPGLNLSENGELSGTPTQYGDHSFVVRATDTEGLSVDKEYTVHIDPVASLTVNVRGAYGGSYVSLSLPVLLSGIEVIVDTPTETQSGFTDTAGNVTLYFNAISTGGNTLTVQDEAQHGLGPENDCSVLPGGVSLESCVGLLYDVIDDEVELNAGTNSKEIRLLAAYDMSTNSWFDDEGFLPYFKFATVTDGVYFLPSPLKRWSEDGSLATFPLQVYIPEFTNGAGIDYRVQAIAAINDWNTNEFNQQYFAVTADPLAADITMDFSEGNSSYDVHFDPWGSLLIVSGTAYVRNGHSTPQGVLHDSSHELGHLLGHLEENSDSSLSVWGGEDLPSWMDRVVIDILSTIPDRNMSKHHND